MAENSSELAEADVVIQSGGAAIAGSSEAIRQLSTSLNDRHRRFIARDQPSAYDLGLSLDAFISKIAHLSVGRPLRNNVPPDTYDHAAALQLACRMVDQSESAAMNQAICGMMMGRWSDDTIAGLRRLAELLKAPAESYCPTEAELNILQAIHESKTAISQVDIEAKSGEPLPTVKRLLPGLERMGLVVRPSGERKGYSLTAIGRAKLPPMD